MAESPAQVNSVPVSEFISDPEKAELLLSDSPRGTIYLTDPRGRPEYVLVAAWRFADLSREEMLFIRLYGHLPLSMFRLAAA